MRSTSIEPLIVTFSSPYTTALLSICINTFVPRHSSPQYRRACSTARNCFVLICSFAWAKYLGSAIENADPA